MPFIFTNQQQNLIRFPFYRQPEEKDCGATCLRIISKYYGKNYANEYLRDVCETHRGGSSLRSLSEASEKLGFKSLGVQVPLAKLRKAPLPCILHWQNNHYVVLYKIKSGNFFISDPAFGLIKYNELEFLSLWIGGNKTEGIALLLETTPLFYDNDIAGERKNQEWNLTFLSKYILKYTNYIWQLALGLFASSILQLIIPFLTQSIVDVGIKNQDIHFIYLILFAYIGLFIGRTSVEVIRSWILLHLSTRININLVSDFFIKLMKLPISYFDNRMTGDILQRIQDHKRVEKILTGSSLNVLFSLFNLIIFGMVLAIYSLNIFAIFLFGSIIYFFWILLFLKKRRKIDQKRFTQESKEQSKVVELINGMQTIKLNNAERKKRWNWEYIQASLFKISIEELRLEQYQGIGSSFITELKNIAITVLSAILVVEGKITLGMMLAITYIVGQLNAPISQLINFIRELQDAKISLERLSEIHNLNNEDLEIERRLNKEDNNLGIFLRNVSFKYPGLDTNVIENLSLEIPPGKITAIVGESGSGKTTLLKLLLKFYKPSQGKIELGTHDLNIVSNHDWRNRCGVVMQEDYIFNDTIANNIAVGVDHINREKMAYSVQIANIKDYVESLPMSYNTQIGMEGKGLSTGQKQRLLIARAVYKDPEYLFFDEATSALDSNNENIIMESLKKVYLNKTVIVIAHRLSTVKNAHQIVLLHEGRITEMGKHEELITKKGKYFDLVKNQLELGK